MSQKLKNESVTSKDWWKTIKRFISPNISNNSIPPLKSDNSYISNPYEKANFLNDYFQKQTLLNDRGMTPPDLPPLHENILQTIELTPYEVQYVLKYLPTGKASGPDGINNRILKEIATEIAPLLCDLFNFSLSTSRVLEKWKEANVCAVFKKGDKSLVSNYRPISLLSNMEKVFERLIFKHIYNFIHENNVLSPHQSGFRPRDSTVNQLMYLYNNYCKALNEGKEIRVIFFDISKAFDRVWHRGLLTKLKSIGIHGTLLSWFSDYLSNRRQRVVLPGTHSDWINIEAGVPQGSILGPLLFLIYINDITSEIQSEIKLFADDTSLSIIIDNPERANRTLSSDINKIQTWANQWLVTFNPSKTESLIISRKINKPIHPPLVMYNQDIPNVPCHKHLGVYLSNNCNWDSHIEYIKTKAWTKINIMKKLKFKLDRKSLEIIYFTFIRPVLEYADVIWDNCTLNDKHELDKIQNEASRIITGTTKLVSISELYKETGWETLTSRRRKHKLILLYKMVNGLTAEYLSQLVPPLIGENSSYSLRNRDNITTVRTRTSQYYNSFLPATIREWNQLPLNIRQSPSLEIFKKSIKENIPPIPKYYFTGTRQCQILHCRLRTNCSSLNQHLFKKNIVVSPSCVCGSVESTYHYFFNCPLYTDIRDSFLNNVRPICNDITLNVLLYGNLALSNDDNILIFQYVQKYITDSKRFI